MWFVLIGSALLSAAAYVAMRPKAPLARDEPPEEDEEDEEEEDEEDEEDEEEPAPAVEDGPNDHDDADVYYNVDAAKARARRARVPKVKS